MRRWAWMMGGWIVWTIHFVGIYAIASIGEVASRASDPAWRMIGLGFSVLCLIAAGVLLAAGWRALRRRDGDETGRFGDQLALLGAALAAVAVVWQAAPTLIGY